MVTGAKSDYTVQEAANYFCFKIDWTRCLICKEFEPRSDPTKRRAWSGSKLFATAISLFTELKKHFDDKNHEKLPSMSKVK